MNRSRILSVILSAAAALVPGLYAYGTPSVASNGIGAEKTCGSGQGRAPAIAVDSRNQPHVVADIQGQGRAYFHDSINGNWQSSSFEVAASQFYNVKIEINNDDQAWISGVLWAGTHKGAGLLVRNSMASAPTAVLSYYHDNFGGWYPISDVSLNPRWQNKAVMNWTRGQYETMNFTGGSIRPSGDVTPQSLAGGEGHELFVSKGDDFRHPDGSVKPVVSVCTTMDFFTSVNPSPVRWLEPSAYPGVYSDHCYPNVVSDNKELDTTYLVVGTEAEAPRGIYMNISRAGGLLRGSNNLFSIDPDGRSGMSRYEINMYPANNGGVWVAYTKFGSVYVRYVSPTGDLGQATRIGAGTRADVCVDKNGDLHLAYSNNGIKYRKVQVIGDNGAPRVITPIGVQQHSRRPVFRWVADDATDLQLSYGLKGGTLTPVDVTSLTSWSPSGELDPGSYVWHVTGTVNNEAASSDPIEFSIAPPTPDLGAVDGSISNFPVTLPWSMDDRLGVDRFQIWIGKGLSDAGTVVYDSQVNGQLSEYAYGGDGPGQYYWTVRAIADDSDRSTAGEWAPYGVFSSGVTEAPQLLTCPTHLSTTGELSVAWSSAASSDWYHYEVFEQSGVRVFNEDWHSETQSQTRVMLPVGNYNVKARGYGAAGLSDFSLPKHVQVDRDMIPYHSTTNSIRPTLTWSGAPEEKWFQLWLGYWNESSQRYVTWYNSWPLDRTVNGDGSFSWELPFNLKAGSWAWSVRSFLGTRGGVNEFSPWSPLQGEGGFSIGLPKAPEIVSPASLRDHDKAAFGTSQTFVWKTVPTAEWYRFRLFRWDFFAGEWVRAISSWEWPSQGDAVDGEISLTIGNSGTLIQGPAVFNHGEYYLWDVAAGSQATPNPASNPMPKGSTSVNRTMVIEASDPR